MRFQKYSLILAGLLVRISVTAVAGPINFPTVAPNGVAETGLQPGAGVILEMGSADDSNLGTAFVDDAATAVPEPATMILIGTGLLLLGSIGRKTVRRR